MAGNSFSFVWSIENFSMCTQVVREFIQSPNILVEEFQGAVFNLRLYPRGCIDEDYTSCVLVRACDDNGPDVVKMDCVLFISEENGLKESEVEKISCSVTKSSGGNIVKLSKLRETLFEEKDLFLPNDVLIFHCCLMPKTYKNKSQKTVYAKTTIQVERYIFVVPFMPTTLDTSTSSNVLFQDCSFNIVFNCLSDQGEIKFQISCCDSVLNSTREIKIHKNIQSKRFLMLKAYLEDSIERCKPIFKKKQLLLTNETGLFITLLEDFLKKLIPKDKFCPVRFELDISGGNYTSTSSLENDEVNFNVKPANEIYQTILHDKKFCDVTLKVENTDFPAHKCFLSAASPVFSALLDSDMKEKETGVIEITDMTKETLKQLLSFIYTDSVSDLQLNNALELYVAADKYHILGLKQICSSFLVAKLADETVCDILEIANLCQDQELERKSRSYISSHTKKVFTSSEWKSFMDKQLKLAADVMFENCIK